MKVNHFGIACYDIDRYMIKHKYLWSEAKAGNQIINNMQMVKQRFVILERNIVYDLLEPLSDNSPISGILKQHGEGIYHICYETHNLTVTINRLKSAGGLVVRKPMCDVAFADSKIAFILLEKELIELLEIK